MTIHSSNQLLKIISTIFSTIVVAMLTSCSPEPEIITVVVTATPEPAIATVVVTATPAPTFTPHPVTLLRASQSVVSNSDDFRALKERAIAEGRSELYAEGYATHLTSGGSPETVDLFATQYEQQRANGKSHKYSNRYAFIYTASVTQGKSAEYARIYGHVFITEFDAAYNKKGKSDYEASQYASSFASAYASARTQGQSEDYAKLLAPAYGEQIMAGKSDEYASAYAGAVADGMSILEASIYATAVGDAIENGKSLEEALANGNAILSAYQSGEYARAISASATPEGHQNPTPTSRAVPTSTPATQEYGRSRNQPKPIRTPIELDNGISISVENVTENANQIIKRHDAWTEPPPSGHQFLILELKVANVGDEPIDLYPINELSLVGKSNVSYDQGFSNECWTFPNEIDTSRTIFPNGSLSGNICFSVESSDVDSLVMYYESISLFANDEFVYWALE